MTASNLPQEPGEKPRPLPSGAPLPRADAEWFRAWTAWSGGPMTGDLEWPGRKVRHPPLTRPGMTYAEAKALVDSGECDGLGLLVDDRLRAEVSDADLKAVQAAGATLFDALGRELYWNARGSLIPVDPSFTPGVRTPGDA